MLVVPASGTIGNRILDEALGRGHELTAVTRDPSRMKRTHERLKFRVGDVMDASSVAAAAKGQDVVVSAIGPKGVGLRVLVEAAHALIDG